MGRLIGILGWVLAALAVLPGARADVLKAGELNLLPPYCQARLGDDKSAQARWEQILGAGNFLHVHHYCFGIAFDQRSLMLTNAKERKLELRRALTNYDYVLERWGPDCVLLPEVHLRKGKLLERMDRSAESVAHYRKAIALKRDWPPAYAALSDLHKKQGERVRAREVLAEGLENAPKSKMLRRRLDGL